MPDDCGMKSTPFQIGLRRRRRPGTRHPLRRPRTRPERCGGKTPHTLPKPVLLRRVSERLRAGGVACRHTISQSMGCVRFRQLTYPIATQALRRGCRWSDRRGHVTGDRRLNLTEIPWNPRHPPVQPYRTTAAGTRLRSRKLWRRDRWTRSTRTTLPPPISSNSSLRHSTSCAQISSATRQVLAAATATRRSRAACGAWQCRRRSG